MWPPPEAVVPFPGDNSGTTSVELPFATEEGEDGAMKSSIRCAGAETPFDVADITEEAVDIRESSKCPVFFSLKFKGILIMLCVPSNCSINLGKPFFLFLVLSTTVLTVLSYFW